MVQWYSHFLLCLHKYVYLNYICTLGGPEGCSQGESNTQATPEQKEKFKELVDIVKGLGQQYAIAAQ